MRRTGNGQWHVEIEMRAKIIFCYDSVASPAATMKMKASKAADYLFVIHDHLLLSCVQVMMTSEQTVTKVSAGQAYPWSPAFPVPLIISVSV